MSARKGEDMSRRYVTEEPNPAERFALYRLCECETCGGSGRQRNWADHTEKRRCPGCRGEGRTRDLVATCATPEAVGVALVTLGREHEWDECPVGILDTMGEPGEKWIVRPWLPSARNLSDAGRVLQTGRKGKT
jgi:hypothetical protein